MSRASVMINVGGNRLFFLSIKVYKAIKIENRRILFFKNKLVRASNNKVIYLKDVEDILYLSDFLLYDDMVNSKKLKENNHSIMIIFMKLVLLIILIFIVYIVFPILNKEKQKK